MKQDLRKVDVGFAPYSPLLADLCSYDTDPLNISHQNGSVEQLL